MHASSAFHIGRGAGRTEHGADKNRARVSQQRTVEATHAFWHQQTRAAGHAHQRAGSVKQLHQEEHQNHVQDTAGQRRHDVELHEGRRDGRRHGEQAIELVATKEERANGHSQNADQHGTRDFQTVQNHDEQKAQHRHDDFRLVHIAHGHIGVGVCCHHACCLECNQRQEQAQTNGNRHPYGLRYAFDDELSQPQQCTDQEQTAGHKDGTQRGLPGEAHLEHHHIGEIRIQPHARRQSDRVVGIQRHDGGTQRSNQAGRHKDCAFGHARIPQDRGIDEHDVGHG